MGKSEDVEAGAKSIAVGASLTKNAEFIATGVKCLGTAAVAGTTVLVAGVGVGLIIAGGIAIGFALFGSGSGKGGSDNEACVLA